MKRPDLTSRELQKYVGEESSKIIQALVNSGLSCHAEEHYEGREAKAAENFNIQIRYDKRTKEIVRIWRTG